MGCFVIDPVGRNSGLAIIWFTDINVRVVGYSNFHIKAHVLNYDDVPCWRFMGFYGHPVQSRHFISWQMIDLIVNSSPLPILMARDWNEILGDSERWVVYNETSILFINSSWRLIGMCCMTWDIWDKPSLGNGDITHLMAFGKDYIGRLRVNIGKFYIFDVKYTTFLFSLQITALFSSTHAALMVLRRPVVFFVTSNGGLLNLTLTLLCIRFGLF